MPLTSDWSSSARLTPVWRWRSRAVRTAASKAGSNGSGAMWAIGPGSSAPSRTKAMWPNVRWSVKRRSGPPSVKVNQIRTCGETGRPGSPSSSWPLMPRWASRASSPTDSHRYLPRRRALPKPRPASAAANSSGPARCLRTARGCSTCTVSMVRPVTCRSRPRRTVSTSGSSGSVFSLASGAPQGAVFPRRSFLAPQSRRHRAPSAREGSHRSGAGCAGPPFWAAISALIAFQAASAACCSATFLDRPVPEPSTRPATLTTARNDFW